MGCDVKVVPVQIKAQRTAVELRILPNGNVLWNDKRIDEPTLRKRFAEASKAAPPVEFRLKPDRRASFEAVTHVILEAQQSGLTKIGFATGRAP